MRKRTLFTLLLATCLGCSSLSTRRALEDGAGGEAGHAEIVGPTAGEGGGPPNADPDAAGSAGAPGTAGNPINPGGAAGTTGKAGHGAGGASTAGTIGSAGTVQAGGAGAAGKGGSGVSGAVSAGAGGVAGASGAAGSVSNQECPVPGQRDCDGNMPRLCDMNNGWTEQAACDGVDSECYAGYCSSPVVFVPVPGGGTYGIDRTEVTQGQYGRWLSAAPEPVALPTGCEYVTTFAPGVACMSLPDVCRGVGCERHPQVCIDWCSAYAYCAGVGKHLCGKIGGGEPDDLYDATQDEWYNACSSGGLNIYPYHQVVYSPYACNTADYWQLRGNSPPNTIEVASLATCQSSVAGYEGVFDLSGNVWEWVNSCQSYSGPNDHCVMRGGWVGNAEAGGSLRCDRAYAGPVRSDTMQYLGFRCCIDIGQP